MTMTTDQTKKDRRDRTEPTSTENNTKISLSSLVLIYPT